jgi:hypothetical protein
MLEKDGMVRTIAVAGVLSIVGCWNKAEEAASNWDYSATVRGALGFKDNILLSKFQQEESAFWQTGADFLLFRLGENGSSLNFSISGNDRRYFSAPGVRKEQDASLLFGWNQPLNAKFETGVDFTYFYLDQVMDASVDEFLITSLQVKTHVLSLEPYVLYHFSDGWFVRFAPQVERDFVDVLDDYTEWGPQIMAGKKYGHKSRATLSYSYHLRYYDTREQIMLDYSTLPGSSLVYDQHEIEARVMHNWDEGRHWRSKLRVSYERNEDNGFGFFDYDKIRFGTGFGYYGDTWSVVGDGKILHYNYDEQQVAGPGSDKWQRWNYLLGLRLEKNVTSNLKLFLESEHEWSVSNDPFTEYQVNTVMSGVDWTF